MRYSRHRGILQKWGWGGETMGFASPDGKILDPGGVSTSSLGGGVGLWAVGVCVVAGAYVKSSGLGTSAGIQENRFGF